MPKTSTLASLVSIKNHQTNLIVREILEHRDQVSRYQEQIEKLSQFRDEYTTDLRSQGRISDFTDFRVFLSRLEQNIIALTELVNQSEKRLVELSDFLTLVDGEKRLIDSKLNQDLKSESRARMIRNSEQCDEQSITTLTHKRQTDR